MVLATMSGRDRAREAVAVLTWASWATSWMLAIEIDYTSPARLRVMSQAAGFPDEETQLQAITLRCVQCALTPPTCQSPARPRAPSFSPVQKPGPDSTVTPA
ncbi:hypothetical protein GCM10010842_25480 [Deinococcus daejeonensis]|uniref:Uncharacterized protein n=1 Tax=Deinococcus daejeonensis TaxID=1007098 RepID=A0ABQ2J900_9DEIO|nr:hypothetical protein GCM10010842_25480 [Deinococcus daejeonensis]